ncbi:dihydrofolate reductase family protein [Leptospira wolbachii]|uniref:dihydrofolate reductase family protein n=1 Tax=Leptospira wolbachii TaxID=29511 RepID=UPI0038BC92C1
MKTFINHNLIDIYRNSIHPIALGSGKPLFEGLKERLNFTLIETNKFKSGVVQVIYHKS